MTKLFQEHEQARATLMAVTTVQAAITFPDVVASGMQSADEIGKHLYDLDLAAAAEVDVLIDEPSAKAWDRLAAEDVDD